MTWNEIMGTASILIVDDEQPNVRLLERMLRRAGYAKVFGTTDSRCVPALCEDRRPDLILLDLHMPEEDGFEIMQQVQANLPPGSFMPILAITGDPSPVTRARANLFGAKDFLTKPMDVLEVLLRVRTLLETRFLFLESQQNEPPAVRTPESTREPRLPFVSSVPAQGSPQRAYVDYRPQPSGAVDVFA